MTVTQRSEPPSVPPAPARRPGIRAILTPGWLGLIALALVFAGACWFVLAPWQYGRHVERSALNNQIESAMAAAPVPVTDLLVPGAEPPESSGYRLVTATGSYVPEEQAFVRLRQQNGSGAAEVVVPFVLTDGTRILVDRGYILNGDLTAGLLPAALPTGQVTLTGRVSADQPDPSRRPAQIEDGRREVYGIDAATLLGGTAGTRLGFVQLVDGAPGVLDPIGVPDRDSGPFLSYALQWAVFGAVALLAAGFFAYREVTDPLEPDGDAPAGPDPVAGSDDAEPAPAAAPAPKPRRAKFDKTQLYD